MSDQPSYKTHNPKGWMGDPKRGAAMGRHYYHLEASECPKFTGKLSLQRVRINNGGYDALGTYWGVGEPLYWCANAVCTIDFALRASSREQAKAIVRKTYPNAKFYN